MTTKLHVNGDHYVQQDMYEGRFYHCDVEGIAKGEDLEHIGDNFETLQEAIFVRDFYANGGHWMDLSKVYEEGYNGKTKGL